MSIAEHNPIHSFDKAQSKVGLPTLDRVAAREGPVYPEISGQGMLEKI
jgi:hypothetical protein